MYYRRFLNDYKGWYDLTTNEQIVYSYLLSSAIMFQSECFGSDGKIDMDAVDESIDCGDGWLEFWKIRQDKIADKCGVRRQGLSGKDGILASLTAKGLLSTTDCGNWLIWAEKGLIRGGFMELSTDTKLNEKMRVFWAFLIERLKHYNSGMVKKTKDERWHKNTKIDTWASKLAEDFGTTTTAVHHFINNLAKRNYVKRDGKYLWLNVELKKVKLTDKKQERYDADIEF